MAPVSLELPLDPIYQGSTWKQPVQILNEDRTPKDLTGKSAKLYLARVGRPELHEFDANYAGSGLLLFGADETDTPDWSPGRYAVEMKLTDGPDVLSLFVGEVWVVKGASAGGSDFAPGAEADSSIVGLILTPTAEVQIAVVDRVVVGGSTGGGGDGSPSDPGDLTLIFNNQLI